jgi:hypothetical protein
VGAPRHFGLKRAKKFRVMVRKLCDSLFDCVAGCARLSLTAQLLQCFPELRDRSQNALPDFI